MFEIAILEHDGYEDPYDEGVQYCVRKWLLSDMEKFTGKWANIMFDGGLKVYEENGDLLFEGSLLDSKDFVSKLKEKI